MRFLMSHYNRFSFKKKLSLVVFTILTHFAFETKINVPFDLQNSIPAPLKLLLEEALLHLLCMIRAGLPGDSWNQAEILEQQHGDFPSASTADPWDSRFCSLSVVLPLVQVGLSRFHSPQTPFSFPKGAAFGEPDLRYLWTTPENTMRNPGPLLKGPRRNREPSLE